MFVYDIIKYIIVLSINLFFRSRVSSKFSFRDDEGAWLDKYTCFESFAGKDLQFETCYSICTYTYSSLILISLLYNVSCLVNNTSIMLAVDT